MSHELPPESSLRRVTFKSTIPEVISRSGIEESIDFASEETLDLQMKGRVGRTEPGSYTLDRHSQEQKGASNA